MGKSAIAINLARRLATAIVSADSRQCYMGMAIGTAQPAEEERQGVPHYFINEFPVTRHITAAGYEELALSYLSDIFSTRTTAVVCGGTGLYIKALCQGLDDMPEVDDSVAQQVNAAYHAEGLAWLQQRVAEEDPEFYAMAETGNPARLLRALIFKRSTGKGILSYRSGQPKKRNFRTLKIGLELPRELLYQRINERVDNMMADGLLNEVRDLYPQRHLKNLQTVGYTELFEYLEGSCSLQEAVARIKQHTRNYAKRQMTWFKKDKEFTWLDARDEGIAEKILAIK